MTQFKVLGAERMLGHKLLLKDIVLNGCTMELRPRQLLVRAESNY